MDNNIFEILCKKSSNNKIDTEQFLTDYYRLKNYNNFKSAELAQNNITNFIEYVNKSIKSSLHQNIPCLFLTATKHIVEINRDYFSIKNIKFRLENIDWKKFEELSTLILEVCFGAVDTSTTQSSADGGVDFEGIIQVKSTISNRIYGNIEVYGQSKRYKGNVGIYDIKAFVAFANNKKRNYVHPPQLFLFFTSSDFAKNSKEELKQNGFIGLNGMQLSTLIFEHKEALINKSNIIIELFE